MFVIFFGSFSVFRSSPRISYIFGPSTTEDTLLVEMCIWSIKIRIVLVLYFFSDVLAKIWKSKVLVDWLIGYLQFYVPLKNFSHITIAGEGLQNLGLCSALRAFEQGGIFIVPHLLWHGTSIFSSLIRRTTAFSHLLRHTRGCGGSILTRILTGNQSIGKTAINRKKNQNIVPWNGAISVEDRAMHEGDNPLFWNEFIKFAFLFPVQFICLILTLTKDWQLHYTTRLMTR
jgi:hypothetical protein